MSGGNRRRADAALLAALARGARTDEAAQSAGVSEATARRRLREEGFREALAAARGRMVDQALGSLADGAAEAVATLRQLIEDESTDAAVRRRAARDVLGGRDAAP